MIKRYEYQPRLCHLLEDGMPPLISVKTEFVRAADYDLLVTEHERTEAELAECANVRDSWCAEFVKCRDALRAAIEYVELDSEAPYPMIAEWKRALTDGAPTLQDLAECEAIGAAVEAVHHYTDSDDVPRGGENG